MKIKITRRKFYNKWLYKVSLLVEAAAALRSFTHEQLVSLDPTLDKPWSIAARASHNQHELIAVSNILIKYDCNTWSKRIESDILDIYTNNSNMVNDLCESFYSKIRVVYKPDLSSLELLEQKNNILCKKLPHDRYKFKAFLLPHMLANDTSSKILYLEWLKTQGDRIKISKSVNDWFMTTNWNWDRRYILIEDEHTLLMLKLRNSDVMGKVYNYVISDK